VPLAAAEGGELRALLRLPADRRVEVTVGYAGQNRVHTDGSVPVVHDPAAPRLPLEIEVRPIFVLVRGRVAGLTPDEREHHALTWLPADEPGARQGASPVALGPDGSFELQVPAGLRELLLIDARPGAWRPLRARVPLPGGRGVEGLVVVADPPPEGGR
jgi:hypothetical protein